MSQVVNAITAIKGDRRRLKHTRLFQDVFSVREDISEVQAMTQTQYRVGVTLGSQCWVDDLAIIRNDNAIELAVQRTKRQVIEAIFGEFREDFRNIERSLYDSDVETARVQLHEMEKKMFDVTLD